MTVTITQTANPASIAAVGTTVTYTGTSIGSEASDRIVCVLSGNEESSSLSPSSCTIDYGSGAVSMNASALQQFAQMTARIFWLPVPTGTTATFVITWSGSGVVATENHIAVYSVTGGIFADTGGNAATTLAASMSLINIQAGQNNIIIPTGGGMLAIGVGATAAAKSWGSLTEDLDVSVSSAYQFGTASSVTANSATRTFIGASGEDGAACWIRFSPPTAVANAGDHRGTTLEHQTLPSTLLADCFETPIGYKSGDLVIVVASADNAAGGGGSPGTCIDNTGDTYTAFQAATDAGTVAARAYYKIASSDGVVTRVTVDLTSGGVTDDEFTISVSVFSGPFNLSAPDKNPTNIANDLASPFLAPATGTLAQASELIVAWIAYAGAAAVPISSPFTSAINDGQGVLLSVGYETVNSTSTVTPQFTGSALSVSVLGTASFELITSYAGSSAGTSSAAAISAVIGLASSAGVATSTAVGVGLLPGAGVGLINGASTSQATGAAAKTAVASSAGLATALAVKSGSAVGHASGVSTVNSVAVIVARASSSGYSALSFIALNSGIILDAWTPAVNTPESWNDLSPTPELWTNVNPSGEVWVTQLGH